jgi:hypothetical protein
MIPVSKSSELPGAIAALSLEKFATSLRADFRFGRFKGLSNPGLFVRQLYCCPN